MKRRIMDAYEELRPDEVTRQRMLHNILSQSADRQTERKDTYMRRSNKRLMMVACLMAFAVMMMGCAWVVLELKDLVIQEETYVENAYYEKDGTPIAPTEKVEKKLSLQGIAGSKNQQAVKEWVDFLETYDPNFEKLEDDYRAPKSFQAYNIYNQEMLEKIQEICTKYGLQPAGEEVLIQHYQTDVFFKALGLRSLLKDKAAAETEYFGGYFYTGGNFNMEFDLTLTKGTWKHPISMGIRYNGKEYLDTVTASVDAGVKQWNLSLSDGTEVLVVQAEEYARVFCDREDAFISIRMGTKWKEETMSAQDIQQAVEALDLTMKPQTPNMKLIQPKLDAAEEAYQEKQEEMIAQAEQAAGENEPWAYSSYQALIADIPNKEDQWPFLVFQNYDNLLEEGSYALMDVTGDGEEELLLGRDGELLTLWMMRNGKTYPVSGSDELYVCEGGIIAQYVYQKSFLCYYFWDIACAGEENSDVAYVGYSAYNGTWEYVDYSKSPDPVTVTEEEAREIVDSFKRIDIVWKPLKNFKG